MARTYSTLLILLISLCWTAATVLIPSISHSVTPSPLPLALVPSYDQTHNALITTTTFKGVNTPAPTPAARWKTCGFYDGNPDLAFTVRPEFQCSIKSEIGAWNVCPLPHSDNIHGGATIECQFPALCVDNYGCRKGCGRRTGDGAKTISWYVLLGNEWG
ncbi:hypothetical protein F4779DRAFT_213129 [Xylariaceae sp. FL0662B]|nr:hypothetical protein F4779DRAFT_213129 [Xylariaceae sp. FL0662B]